jgi:hypothetical protein
LRLTPKALMSTSLGMILWVLFLGGILWANLSAKRGLDEALCNELNWRN